MSFCVTEKLFGLSVIIIVQLHTLVITIVVCYDNNNNNVPDIILGTYVLLCISVQLFSMLFFATSKRD